MRRSGRGIRGGGRAQARLATYASAFPADDLSLVRRARSARPWSKIASAILLVASAVLFAHLLTDARFRVREVTVAGAQLVDATAVQAQIGLIGQSVFGVPARKLERDLQAAFGCIEQATVRCQLPNRVTVRLRERETVLAWESGGRFWWIAPDGQVLGATGDPKDRLVVHDLKGIAPDPGEYVIGVPWEYIEALAGELGELRSLDYALEEGLILTTQPDQWPVFLGYEGDAARKVAVLRELVGNLRAEGAQVEYIDLRVANRPVIKPRPTR